MTPNTPTDYAELTSVHTRLVELGFSATLDEIERMRSTHGADAIQRVLEVAENDGARQFLSNLIAKARQDVAQATAAPRQRTLFAVPAPRPGWKQTPIPVARHRPALRATEQLRIEGKQACVTVSTLEVAGDASVTLQAKQIGADDGITLVLTPAEILRVFAVTLDYLPKASGRGRDGVANRWFLIEHQRKQLCLKVAKDKSVCCVWLNEAQAMRLSAVMLAQARKNLPVGADADIESLVRRVVAPMVRAASH